MLIYIPKKWKLEVNMKIPKLKISSQDIQLKMNTRHAQQTIEQKSAQLSIEQPAATLEIRTSQGEVTFDSGQFWEDLGFKETGTIIKEFSEKGRQDLLSGIARRVQEGRKLMTTAGKGQGVTPIQSIAKENYGPKRAGPINISFIPSYNSIKTQYNPSEVTIDSKENKPKIEVETKKPIVEYIPGQIQIEVEKYQSITIDWSI